MATANLLYRVDAGPLLSTSSTLAGGETISLTASSFAGWAASAALWEILDYPPGWPAPAGWSTDSVNERYYYRASTGPSGVTPPDFVVPTAPTFGKILFRLTVNGTIFSAVLGVKTRSPTIDLDDLAYGESDQWGGPKQWPKDQKDNLRKIDAAALAAAGTEYVVVDSATTAFPNGVPIRAMTSALAFVRLLATSGATADVLDVNRDTGGTINNGEGGQVRMRISDGVGGFFTAGTISCEVVNKLVLGGPSTRLVFGTTTGGTAYPGITLSGAGAVRFNGAAYASAGGRFVVDASGNITLQAVTEAEVRTALASAAGDVDVNGQNLTGVNNLTVGGDLTVSGTTTTIDSTTVTVADRLVVVNSSTGIVPVPVDVAGFVVDRGSADGMTKRDGVGIFWDEANSRFDFAYNTTLDQSTVGAFVPAKFSGLTLSGLSTGVVHSDASGVLSSSLIVNADVNAAAAIAGTKISPDFGAQNVTTTGSVTAGAAGFIGPQIDRATSGTLTIGTNITTVAGTSLLLTGVGAISNTAGALSLSAGAGNMALTASGVINANTGSGGGVNLSRSGQTTTVFGNLSVVELVNIASLLTRTNGSSTSGIDLKDASTTDATATTIATYPVPASGSVGILTYIKGPQDTGANGFQQLAVNSARRSGAGAPTLSQGATGIILATLENTYAVVKPSVQFVISGNNLLVQVVGKAATNINWTALLIDITR